MRGAGLEGRHEPNWSDLDLESRVFVEKAADRVRLVTSFVENGELIHPRHERREPTTGELPKLQVSCAISVAYLWAGKASAPRCSVGEGLCEKEESPVPPAGHAGRRRAQARRRLASGPRVAK